MHHDCFARDSAADTSVSIAPELTFGLVYSRLPNSAIDVSLGTAQAVKMVRTFELLVARLPVAAI